MAQWVGAPALEVSGRESYLHHPYKELRMLVHVCIPSSQEYRQVDPQSLLSIKPR